MSDRLNEFLEDVKFDANLHTEIFLWNKEHFFQKHWHPAIEIIYCMNETYQILANDTEYTLQEGNIALIRPGVVHALHSPKQGQQLFCLADLSIFQDVTTIETLLSLLPSVTIIEYEKNPDLADTIIRLLSEMEKETLEKTSFYEMAIYSKLMELMLVIGRSNLIFSTSNHIFDCQMGKYAPLLLHVCNYIHEHCTEELSLDQISQMVGFSKYHFSRLFKEFTNDSFYKYVTKKRITHAESLLSHSDYPITEVALQSGFSSLSAFIRMFKQIKGYTPTQFRNMQTKLYPLK